MGMGMTTTSTQVTISGDVIADGLPSPTTAQTPINNIHITSSTNVETMYTVTAGKTFYLYGISVMSTSSTTCKLYDSAGTTELWFCRIDSVDENAMFTPVVPIAVYTTAQDVKIRTVTNSGAQITIVGYEV